jgi:hypothetical protein
MKVNSVVYSIPPDTVEMAAPKIRLTYFNGEGRAEITRLILAHAGVEYEDCRIEVEDWLAIKGKIDLPCRAEGRCRSI